MLPRFFDHGSWNYWSFSWHNGSGIAGMTDVVRGETSVWSLKGHGRQKLFYSPFQVDFSKIVGVFCEKRLHAWCRTTIFQNNFQLLFENIFKALQSYGLFGLFSFSFKALENNIIRYSSIRNNTIMKPIPKADYRYSTSTQNFILTGRTLSELTPPICLKRAENSLTYLFYRRKSQRIEEEYFFSSRWCSTEMDRCDNFCADIWEETSV